MARVIDANQILPEGSGSLLVTGTSPIYTTAQKITSYSNAAFQINYGSGLTATFNILASLDGENFGNTGIFVPATNPASAGVSMGNLSAAGYFWVQLEIIPSAGSADINVWFGAKEG